MLRLGVRHTNRSQGFSIIMHFEWMQHANCTILQVFIHCVNKIKIWISKTVTETPNVTRNI